VTRITCMQTVLVLKDIVRRYPDVAAPYAGTLLSLPVSDLEPEAVPAYLWLRGEMVYQGVQEPDGCEPVLLLLFNFFPSTHRHVHCKHSLLRS
jgi:hypothetical protein